eukprot:m.443890 g.443890  ORF g.443890 m.443890 type:complete len:488 (+) comp19024_c0_seq1:181-1644(+)
MFGRGERESAQSPGISRKSLGLKSTIAAGGMAWIGLHISGAAGGVRKGLILNTAVPRGRLAGIDNLNGSKDQDQENEATNGSQNDLKLFVSIVIATTTDGSCLVRASVVADGGRREKFTRLWDLFALGPRSAASWSVNQGFGRELCWAQASANDSHGPLAVGILHLERGKSRQWVRHCLPLDPPRRLIGQVELLDLSHWCCAIAPPKRDQRPWACNVAGRNGDKSEPHAWKREWVDVIPLPQRYVKLLDSVDGLAIAILASRGVNEPVVLTECRTHRCNREPAPVCWEGVHFGPRVSVRRIDQGRPVDAVWRRWIGAPNDVREERVAQCHGGHSRADSSFRKTLECDPATLGYNVLDERCRHAIVVGVTTAARHENVRLVVLGLNRCDAHLGSVHREVVFLFDGPVADRAKFIWIDLNKINPRDWVSHGAISSWDGQVVCPTEDKPQCALAERIDRKRRDCRGVLDHHRDTKQCQCWLSSRTQHNAT